MADFFKKWQAFISLAIILVTVTLAWGEVQSRVGQLEFTITQKREDTVSVVRELRLIREEIVLLRIATATTNQKLESHLSQRGDDVTSTISR